MIHVRLSKIRPIRHETNSVDAVHPADAANSANAINRPTQMRLTWRMQLTRPIRPIWPILIWTTWPHIDMAK